MLTLAIVVAVAAAAAYLAASRLYQGSVPDAVASASLIFVVLLVSPMLAAGVLGVMKPAAVVAVSLSLCGLLLVFRTRLPVLIPSRPRGFRASPVELLLIAGLVIAIGFRLWKSVVLVLNELHTGTNTDVILFEVPAVVDFVQSGTLWIFDQCFPYYPANYGLLMAWGIMLTKSYSLNPLVQLFTLFAVLAHIGALTNLVLERKPAAHRAIAALAVILAFLLLRLQSNTIDWVGKNDLFIGCWALASLLHLMRYWTDAEPRRDGHQVLAGLALGLMIGTKFSAIYWAAVMGVGHGVLLLRGARRSGRRWLGTVALHLVLVGAPVLFFAGLWALRVFLGYDFVARDEAFVELGWGNTIWNLYRDPLIAEATPRWMPYFALTVAGGLLGIAPWKRLPAIVRLAGLAAAYIGFYEVTSTSLYWDAYLGPLALCLAISVLPQLARWSPSSPGNVRLSALGGIATVSLLLFVVTPFSAWTGAEPGVAATTRLVIAYRYALASFALVLIALVGLGVELIPCQRPRSFFFEPRQFLPRGGSGRRNVHLASLIIILGMPICILARASGYERLDSLGRKWENFAGTFQEPTSIYSWARNNIRDSSVLVVGLPPAHFYGEQIGDNRVFSGCRSWADTGTIDWGAAAALIERERIEHVLFGLQFHGGRLGPATLSQVADMRDEYPILFEDEQAVVFATKYRRPRPPSRSIVYDFSTLAGENLRLLGFRRVENGEAGRTLRWTNATRSQIWARVESGHDLSVRFRVERGVRPSTPQSLRLSANGVGVGLRRTRASGGGQLFEARVPQALLRSGDSELELRFEVDQVADGLEAGVRRELGDVGLLFDWLRIEPANAAGSRTGPSSASPAAQR